MEMLKEMQQDEAAHKQIEILTQDDTQGRTCNKMILQPTMRLVSPEEWTRLPVKSAEKRNKALLMRCGSKAVGEDDPEDSCEVRSNGRTVRRLHNHSAVELERLSPAWLEKGREAVRQGKRILICASRRR